MEETSRLFIGIDLNNSRAMVSLYYEGMTEPETVSTVSGEEHFRIPAAVFCSDDGQNYFGEEALKRRDDPDGSYYANLYNEALAGNDQTAREILTLFLGRLIRFSERIDKPVSDLYLAVTVPEIDDNVVSLFSDLRKRLGFSTDSFQLMDYSESFFAYVYHQDPSVYRHEVALFDYEKGDVLSVLLHADAPGEIKRVTAVSEHWDFPGYLEGQPTAMDEFFSNIVSEAFEKNIISGVYFVGDGFDGDWMSESLRVVGPNKRVFMGKNLYTVGACYAAYRYLCPEGWNYYFDCSYKLQGEITLQVLEGGETIYIRLVQLGENWFSPTEKYYLLYDGDPTIETWTRFRKRMNARKDSFTLEFIPERAPRSIRLSIQAFPVSGKEVLLRVKDEGFGEMFESSGKIWEFPILL